MSYEKEVRYAALVWAASTVILIAIVLLVCALNTAANEYEISLKSTPFNGVVIDGVTYDKKGRRQQ